MVAGIRQYKTMKFYILVKHRMSQSTTKQVKEVKPSIEVKPIGVYLYGQQCIYNIVKK